LVVLQYLPEGRLHCEVWPASSSDANVDVNVRVEEYLDIEEDVNPISTTSSGIKAVIEVSCVSVRWISQVQVSLVLRTSLL
jgi:hypothetical protein